MVDMLEGVEDICASLGLGHIPLLNEENRELNRKLQELQVRLNKLLILTSEVRLCPKSMTYTK